MASNVSREKLLFYAAAGALGGFAAWGLSEPILGIRWVYGRDILFGALIGALISAFLASIETLSVGQLRQAARRFVVGGAIGAAGGALGQLVGEGAFGFLWGFFGRIFGWGLLGIAGGPWGGGGAERWDSWWGKVRSSCLVVSMAEFWDGGCSESRSDLALDRRRDRRRGSAMGREGGCSGGRS